MTQPATPPAAPPPLVLDMTQWSEDVDTAVLDKAPCVIASANADGEPDLAFKGSMMVYDKDHLAYWERGFNETLNAIRSNPHVCVLLRHKGGAFRFYGEARIVEDSAEREAVWERVVDVEKKADPEKKGFAVKIRVDRIRSGPRSVKREG